MNRVNSDSEVEVDSGNEMSETSTSKPEHSRRAFTRPFVHLEKRLEAVPTKRQFSDLEKAGRARDLCFTKNHSHAEIERLLLSNFPTLVGLDLSCLRFLKSYSSGRSMAVVFRGVPSGDQLATEFKGSTTKRVYMYWKRPRAAAVTSTSTGTTLSAATTTSTSALVSTATATNTTTAQATSSLHAPTLPAGIDTTVTSAGPSTHAIPTTTATVPNMTSTLTMPSLHTGTTFSSSQVSSSSGPLVVPANPVTWTATTSVTSNVTPRDGLSTRRYLATLAGHSSENDDDDLLQGPSHEIVEINDSMEIIAVEIDPVGEQVGDFTEDLSPHGIVNARRGKVSLGKMDRMQEVLICESELLEGNIFTPMPVFLNLSFDELCHQGRGDEHMMICAVIKDGDDLYPLRRVLSLLEKGNGSMYFWIAKSGSKSARQVTDKFGSNSPATELFVLAPTMSKPVLVERFSGDTLSNVNEEEVTNAIQQGKKSLEGLRNERERTNIIEEQAKELEESLNIDKKKCQAKMHTEKNEPLATSIATKKVGNEGASAQVRKDRTNRTTTEPKEGVTIVLRYNQKKLSRRFRKSAMFQEVYDWSGAMESMPLHFTIQRRSEVIKHDHAIQGDEVLDIYEREEKEVKALLNSQSVIAEEMMTKLHMEGWVNGQHFEIEGVGKGKPYEGEQTMQLTVKGEPLPFSYVILLPEFFYGSKAFIKYPDDIPDYIKLSFPDGITWERIMTFEDGAVCTVCNDTKMVGNCFIYEVKFLGVNFPPNGPVMQKKITAWEPSTERVYERDGWQKGDVHMALRLKDGGLYMVDFKSIYKSKKGLKVPECHFIDHKLDILKCNEDCSVFEQREIAAARNTRLA